VRDLGEVFTAETQVEAMLDLVGAATYEPTSRFLEPACGTGNFTVAVLSRKLEAADARYRAARRRRSERQEAFEARRQDEYEFLLFIAVSSIYGIEICPDNVETTRERMRVHALEHCSAHPRNALKSNPGLAAALNRVLEANIQQGDTLNGTSSISFVEYTFPGTDIAKSTLAFKVQPRSFTYGELLAAKRELRRARPTTIGKLTHYLEVAP